MAIKIYTVAGRLIRTLGPVFADPIPTQNRIPWDGRDDDGDALANGVYLYKLIVYNDTLESASNQSNYGKLVIHR